MKKLAVVLCSLLIASTALAESVPRPVLVKDIIPNFQPKGYVSLEAEYRGDSEHGGAEKKRIESQKNKKYSGKAQEHVFLELLGSVSLTPKDTFAFRARDYISVINESDSQYTGNEKSSKTDMRLRWNHAFGQIPGTKVTFTTRLEARLNETHDAYTLYNKFQFKNYFSKSKFYKINSMEIAPKFRYTDFDLGREEYATGAGVDLGHAGSMNLGAFGTLETAVNLLYIYSDTNSKRFRQQKVYGGANTTTKVNTSNGNTTALEAYLYHTLPLWASESKKYKVQFYHEGGLDPMVWNHRSNDGAGLATVVYYEPKVQLIQQVNTATSLTYSAGAMLRNNESDGNGRTSDYQWEPRAGVILRTKF